LPKRGIRSGWLKFLTKKQLSEIHYSCVELLEEVGMKCPSERMLKIFSEGGAETDFENRRVRIPQHMIKDALGKVPKQITLYGRKRECDLLVGGERIHFGIGGTPCPQIWDLDTGDFRRSTKKDVANVAKLCDALGNVSFLMSIAGAYDVPYEVEYLHEFDATFSNTEKPILHPVPGALGAKLVIEMAAAIAEGFESLRKRPFFTVYSETVQPLCFSVENENMIECAENGIPMVFGPAPMMGASAPMSIIGAIVTSNCENLAQIVFSQIVQPHTPILYGCWASVMEPRTGRCLYAAPEFALGHAIGTQMAHDFYGLPNFAFAGPADSKVPDAQAGVEAAINCMTNALAGANLLHDGGYLASGSIGSMEMVVILNEIFGYVGRIVAGTEVDDDSLAVDVLKEVGPGGNFLGHKHTLRRLHKELYLANLFDVGDEASWANSGRKDIRQVANERAKKILAEHRIEPLPVEVQGKIERIIKEAKSQMVH
jgi:trimethylamine--corrinoid protein Co-methyltransferase